MTTQTTKRAGRKGERIARTYLEARGLRFISANWSCRLGEIDLIMQDGAARVLVEVRLRSPTSYGAGVDTVAQEKQRKLVRTSQLYQQQEDWWGDIRFDVVSITAEEGKAPVIEHIEYAF